MRRNYFQLHLGLNGKIPPTPFSPFVPSPIPGQWSSHATDELSQPLRPRATNTINLESKSARVFAARYSFYISQSPSFPFHHVHCAGSQCPTGGGSLAREEEKERSHQFLFLPLGRCEHALEHTSVNILVNIAATV